MDKKLPKRYRSLAKYLVNKHRGEHSPQRYLARFCKIIALHNPLGNTDVNLPGLHPVLQKAK